jgi:predicted nucleotidyltransferase
MPTSDYSAILQCLNICGAKYLVVGGYAVMRYSEPRFTKDLDLWIDNGPENIKLVLSALRRFGAPVASISAADLQHPEMVLQIGVAPVRVDILTSVPGLEFEQSWHNRETVLWDGVETHFASKEDLIRAKRAAGRPSDRRDLKSLLKKKKARSNRTKS